MTMQKVKNETPYPIKLEGILRAPIRPGATVLVPVAYCAPRSEHGTCIVKQMAPQLTIGEVVPDPPDDFAEEYQEAAPAPLQPLPPLTSDQKRKG